MFIILSCLFLDFCFDLIILPCRSSTNSSWTLLCPCQIQSSPHHMPLGTGIIWLQVKPLAFQTPSMEGLDSLGQGWSLGICVDHRHHRTLLPGKFRRCCLTLSSVWQSTKQPIGVGRVSALASENTRGSWDTPKLKSYLSFIWNSHWTGCSIWPSCTRKNRLVLQKQPFGLAQRSRN